MKPVIDIPSFNVKIPEIYQIEVTNDCIFNCDFCIRKILPRPKTYLEKNLAKRIAERDLGGSYFVEFQMAGEPLLHPDLKEIISYFKGSVLTGLSTNGYLIHTQFPALLSLDYLTISIDSLTNYNKVRKGGDLNKLLDNLDLFFKLKLDKETPYVDFQIIEFKGYEKEIEILETLKKNRGWNANIRSTVDCFLGFTNNKVQVNCQELCLNPFMSVSIQADGDVTPCCFSFGKDIVLGNVATDSLEGIWNNSKELALLRHEHMKQSYRKICSKCYMRSPVLLHWKLFQESIVKKMGCKK